MSKETDGTKTTPGSGAGDAAPTQAIPRLPKPDGSKPAAKAPTTPGASTDKGRPRDTKVQAAPPAKPASPPAKPSSGAPGRPITAAEYARTTKASADTTSVIPAVKDPAPSAKPAKPAVVATGGSGRKASLRLTHIEPWSVTRLTFSISVALMVVAVVAAAIFWIVLNVIGVWGQINDALTSVLADDSSAFDVKDYFGFGRFVGLTLVLSAINVVLMTMFATIGAHIYNLAAQLMGGVEVTFSEEK